MSSKAFVFLGLLLAFVLLLSSEVAARDLAETSSKKAMWRRLATTTKAAHGTRWASTFRVLGLQQIAIGGTDKQALSHLWVDLFGLTKKGDFKSERENVDEDILECGKGPFAVEVDIMQPLDENMAPKVHVPPLNHIGLWIDDLPAAVKELSDKGMRFTPGGIRKGAAGYDVVFIHPKGNEATPLSGQGVLIELVQAPQEVIEAFDAIKA